MRIIGLMVCGGGEADRYLEGSLQEFERLCDDAMIALNNGTQAEIDLIEKYGFTWYADDREWGVDQPNIKTDLLKKIGEEMNPDWIIALDADERFAPEFTRDVAEKLVEQQEIAFHFMVVNLYNDENHFAHGAGVQRFWNIRFYKYLPEYGLQFQRKNLHCGLAPPIMYQYGWYAPFYLAHYGLIESKDRQRRVDRYATYDPQARFKNRVYYDDLAREMPVFEFDRQGLLDKLASMQEGKPRDRKPDFIEELYG